MRPSPATAVPIVIAHRGASGYLPEHTLPAYFLAVQQGADYIEPDLVATRDGVLVARHENEISRTTDVAQHSEFADRRRVQLIDGEPVQGWFTEDFTLAELKMLRARERIPELRPGGARFDGQFEVPTFAEVLALVRALDEQRAAMARARRLPAPPRIGVYPETKHPSHFASCGLALEGRMVEALHAAGFTAPEHPAFIQSFETGNLRRLRGMTDLRLVQLVAGAGAPWDLAAAGDPRCFADLIGPAGLAEVARYAHAIGVAREMVIPRGAAGTAGQPTRLVDEAHTAGLLVHVWTLRAENAFLPLHYRRGAAVGAAGDMESEARDFLAAGVDGFFTDHPFLGVQARAQWLLGR